MSDPPSGTLLSHKDYEVRVTAAFIVGVASIPLIYPLGVVLGPVGLWLSISAYRRIKGSGGGLAGSRLALGGSGASRPGSHALPHPARLYGHIDSHPRRRAR